MKRDIAPMAANGYEGDPLQVKVNKLSSTKTQLPYDYYYLNYCKPKHIQNSVENLGEVLRGDRIENSVYTILDNLPVVVIRQRRDGSQLLMNMVSALGLKETMPGVMYHKDLETDSARLVGFEVTPNSKRCPLLVVYQLGQSSPSITRSSTSSLGTGKRVCPDHEGGFRVIVSYDDESYAQTTLKALDQKHNVMILEVGLSTFVIQFHWLLSQF
ncbi:transmembrane 9 superfamily member 7-like protein [Tanacetum coccineum]|uniref:Transmembrane 9 superfamily member n=1 Tax=Tanacetum coccineum TaxID=301880 RepID=A0ABQ5J3D7_9ASTR